MSPGISAQDRYAPRSDTHRGPVLGMRGMVASSQTLATAAERAGIEPAEMKEALEQGSYIERALEAVNGARRIGITSTPTIFLGRTRINGWHYYEVLQSVMEQQGMKPKELVPS